MRIGIFGCTADPFTEAHAAIVGEVLAQNLVDRVIIAPTIVDWHRGGKTSWLNDDQKCELISLMLQNDPTVKTLPALRVGYWDIWERDFKLREVCKGNLALEEKYVKSHRFIDTLVDIIESKEWNYNGDKKNNEYYVILGTDSYLNFKTWGMWQEIPKLAKIIVIKGRDGVPLPAEDDPTLPYIGLSIKDKYANVSASKIREEWMSKGFDAYKMWLIDGFKAKDDRKDEELLHTPIFDVVRAPELIDNPGLKPIKVNAPDWVTVIVEKDGKFLVEKQFRYGSNCEIEEFPCGMVNKNEPPVCTAARELQEETGYKVLPQSFEYLGFTNPNPAFMTNKMHYFYVNLDGLDDGKFTVVGQSLDEHEKLSFEWKSKDVFFDETFRKIESGIQVPAILLSAFKLYEKKVQESIRLLREQINDFKDKKVFIAGPMRGYEKYNFPKFDKIEKILKDNGVECVNPGRISRKFKEKDVNSDIAVYNEMVRLQQEAERTCNAILLLDGWQHSKGVALEVKTAAELRMQFLLESDLPDEWMH